MDYGLCTVGVGYFKKNDVMLQIMIGVQPLTMSDLYSSFWGFVFGLYHDLSPSFGFVFVKADDMTAHDMVKRRFLPWT